MKDFEIPKSVFLSLQEFDYEKINNIPVYAYDKTLEEISSAEPIKATKILNDTLLYSKYLRTDIQIIGKSGNITSELDGESIAYSALRSLLSKSLSKREAIEPLDIVISTFIKMGLGKNQQKVISKPKIIINLKK